MAPPIQHFGRSVNLDTQSLYGPGLASAYAVALSPAGALIAAGGWTAAEPPTPCMQVVRKYLMDGTLVGDPLWKPGTQFKVPEMPEPMVTEDTVTLSRAPAPMSIDPATFNGRDPGAFRQWLEDFRACHGTE